MIVSTLRNVWTNKILMMLAKNQPQRLTQKYCYNSGSRRNSQVERRYKTSSRQTTTNLANPEDRTRQRNYNKITEYKQKNKHSSQVSLFFNKSQQARLALIQQLKVSGRVRQLSMLAQQMLFQPQSSQNDLLWCAIQQSFLSAFKPTKNQSEIRSYGKLIYALGKSKKATYNYQTQMALLLPFSSHQSFTQIVTSISRMGGMSEEFSHIVEKLYWKRKQQFSKLEVNLINYVLAKNGKRIDTQLIEHITSFPLKSIVMMLKSYDMSSTMTTEILRSCIPAIIARKQQTNLLDLRGIVNVYSKYLYLDDERLVSYIVEQYKILARNVNEEALEEIWEFFPQAVNVNKFPIAFVEQVIKSLKILKTRQRISERTWKKIAITFGKFQNLEIRTQLQKI